MADLTCVKHLCFCFTFPAWDRLSWWALSFFQRSDSYPRLRLRPFTTLTPHFNFHLWLMFVIALDMYSLYGQYLQYGLYGYGWSQTLPKTHTFFPFQSLNSLCLLTHYTQLISTLPLKLDLIDWSSLETMRSSSLKTSPRKTHWDKTLMRQKE